MSNIELELRGVKRWEVILALEKLGGEVRNERIINNRDKWCAVIINEGVEMRYGFLIPFIKIRVYGKDENVKELINKLKLRLLKAGG